MISILVSEKKEKERELLIEMVKHVAAKGSEERLEFFTMGTPDEEEEEEEEKELPEKLDAAIVDVTEEDGISVAKQLRREYPEIEILIVSDAGVSPILYLNPEVRAASLLLLPLQKDVTEQTIEEFLNLFVKLEREDCFYVEQKGEKKRLPYQKIRYLEAREKRVYVRMQNVEYGIYDTIDHLAEIFPREFIRCHRSYVVNCIYIERIRYADNIILLTENQIIPLSRSYKTKLKEVMSHV